mmetsp:Transcript_46741/g.84389  ORF Transcript_46741/g.84389 Transcript_46741/m.84389 type:complete len:326 (+) Transcript_46741:560-1537(+)
MAKLLSHPSVRVCSISASASAAIAAHVPSLLSIRKVGHGTSSASKRNVGHGTSACWVLVPPGQKVFRLCLRTGRDTVFSHVGFLTSTLKFASSTGADSSSGSVSISASCCLECSGSASSSASCLEFSGFASRSASCLESLSGPLPVSASGLESFGGFQVTVRSHCLEEAPDLSLLCGSTDDMLPIASSKLLAYGHAAPAFGSVATAVDLHAVGPLLSIGLAVPASRASLLTSRHIGGEHGVSRPGKAVSELSESAGNRRKPLCSCPWSSTMPVLAKRRAAILQPSTLSHMLAADWHAQSIVRGQAICQSGSVVLLMFVEACLSAG